MEIYGPLIEQQVTAMRNQMDVVGKPFQILGLDLLIDEELKAWVLEVNDHPSLNIYFDSSKEPMGVTKEFTDADICPVDFLVKSTLAKDTIQLAKKSKETVIGTEQFGSLTKIHPECNIVSTEGAVDIRATVLNLRQIFY